MASSPKMRVCSSGSIDGESKGECAVDNEDGSWEQKHIESDEVVPANALRSPRTMMIVPNDAHVAVIAVQGLLRNIKPALSTETIIKRRLPCAI